jgi:[ribosomal protein S18]-alanine N-acetyltransferase
VSGLTRPATPAELAWVATPAVRSHVVDSAGELGAISAAAPWRVRVTERGEAAVVGPWREHLSDCAVFGLWCSTPRVPAIVEDLAGVAREHGFSRLVGPLVPLADARVYARAGLDPVERILVMRYDFRSQAARREDMPDGLTLRDATEADLDAVLALDAECFDPFWHFDPAQLEHLARTGRMAVGTVEGTLVGYTLTTLRAGDGSLGRLAVAPAGRRRGIGRALVGESLGWLAQRGARHASLSTQEDNTASRTLYRSMGFRETADTLVVCASSALLPPAGGEER